MVATFLQKLKHNYPEFTFKTGLKFVFHPPKTIFINPSEPHADFLTLHELSHALLKHFNFQTDIERLKMETEAWNKTRQLAKQYQIPFDESFIQSALDTYRNWLHTKSRCKICGLTRYQSPNGKYHCPLCEQLKRPPKRSF